MRSGGDGSPMQRGGAMNAMNARCISIILAMCSLGTLKSVASAQDDPQVGTWELNLAKSTFSPGPPPGRQTLTFQTQEHGLTAVLLVQGVDAVESRSIRKRATWSSPSMARTIP